MNEQDRAANSIRNFRWPSIVIMVFASSMALSAGVNGKVIADNTPRYVATAKNLGSEDPTKVIEVSIWLQLHDQSKFDALTASLYDSSSANYRHFLKPQEIAARFGPTADEAKTVRQFFEDHNLTVVKTGADNFYVRARGTVGDVEKAFHVQLNNYEVRGKTIRANVGDPYVEGPAGDLVRAVSGLDSGGFEHHVIVRQSGLSGKPLALAKPAAVADSDFFSSQCFTGTGTETMVNNGSGFPIGTYKGNLLNLGSATGLGCAYTPPVIQNAYNLTALYGEHGQPRGADQTIAIIDWCGSATILNDVNAFSAEFGLPQLIPADQFQQPFLGIIYTAPSSCISWNVPEINLDVEWSHAIAPDANINLVVPPTSEFQDVNQAEFDVVNLVLGTVLSGSYGVPEPLASTSELETESLLSEIGAAEGISTNFSSGDYGDYTFEGPPATVNAPADSPWATAVGGVSLALNADNSIAWQAGWGTNAEMPVYDGTVAVPPYILGLEIGTPIGFQYGSGGGPSDCLYVDSLNLTCLGGFPKPSYQANLPGNYRQLPDISWLGDPNTGAAILISIPGIDPPQVWEVIGGTSLAAPMFSGLWVIANQAATFAGHPPLGQAAPYLYSLPADTIHDIVPVTSGHNVTASIEDATGTNKYNASEVFGGAAPPKFVSAMWDDAYLNDTLLVLSFGTDCAAITDPILDDDGTACNSPQALTTTKGWDNVTGVGTPNAKAFVDYFRKK